MKSINKLLTGLAAGLLLTSFSAIPADHGDAPLFRGDFVVLEVEGVAFARFAEVQGLGAEIEVVEFREGGEPGGVIRKIPGATKYGNVTLTRGYTASDDLWTWLQEIIDGNFVRKNAAIILIASNGSEIARFRLSGAWPISYRVGVDSERDNSVVIESLALSVERVDFD